MNKLDYDDLLYLYYLGIIENDDYVQDIGSNLYLLVDEYQDTNIIQLKIIEKIGSVNNQVFAVGDDLQSIYLFRGANYQVLEEYREKLCKGASPIFIKYNYRSKSNIVEYINKFTDSLTTKLYSKELLSCNDELGVITYNLVSNPYDEARAVVDKIKELLTYGISHQDIAVLYRSDYMANALEAELSKNNLRYVKFGGRKFLERAHVKDVFALIMLLINTKDTLAAYRVLNRLFHINPSTLDKIIKEIDNKNLDLLEPNTFSHLHENTKNKILNLSIFLKSLYNKKDDALARDIVEQVTKFAWNYLIDGDDMKKKARIESDFRVLRVMSNRYNRLIHFVNDAYLNELTEDSEEEKENHIILSTIHGVKGKEYKVVILIHAGYVSKKVLEASYNEKALDSKKEEERVYYVGITRAKEQLHLYQPEESIGWFRFIDFPEVYEVPEGELKDYRGKYKIDNKYKHYKNEDKYSDYLDYEEEI